MNVAPCLSNTDPLPAKETVEIGKHWSPQHAIYTDRESGMYWERNPPMSASDLRVQAALLHLTKQEQQERQEKALQSRSLT